MDNTESEMTDVPEWLLISENYIPLMDKDTFVNKSILSIFKVISRIKMQDSIQQSRFNINVSLNVLCTAILLILVSLTKSFVFVMIINVYLLSILCVTDTDRLVRILKLSAGVTLFTAIIMLPAFIQGNSYSSIMITTKVFASITVVGLLSHTTKWSLLTKALKRFYVPDIFILILDITIKYIYRLGELSLNMFYALKLRSVGRNNKKYTSMAGVAGTMFLQSMEMAEEMYHAMECRGFSGEYHRMEKSKFKWIDYFYITIHIGFFVLYLYLGRMLP
ncbi:energy-coupling factor transporter transmembrane component T family protein [Lacrimispora sp.]|uniref:energy-coupling factor transporter transmembrane component T family protein n=1 Tax=Lacrimispora sp. TaxID=2719234 RepID=UPI0028A9186A|nr:energy-coupling factor transporter transmembrane component T [Lacrimispora sp.]